MSCILTFKELFIKLDDGAQCVFNGLEIKIPRVEPWSIFVVIVSASRQSSLF